MAMHTVAPMTGTEIVYLLGAVVVLLAAGLVLLLIGRDTEQPPVKAGVPKHLDDRTAAIYTTRPRHRQRVTGVAHVDNRWTNHL